MSVILGVILLALVAFTSADYTLGRAKVQDPAGVVIAAIFALLCVLFGVAFWGARL
jgi:hypothetical protein